MSLVNVFKGKFKNFLRPARLLAVGLSAGVVLAYFIWQLPFTLPASSSVGSYYNMDVCGNLHTSVATSETPDCGATLAHIDSYSTKVTITNTSNYKITGTFCWDRYFCKDDNGTGTCGGPGNPKADWSSHDCTTYTFAPHGQPGDTKEFKSDTTTPRVLNPDYKYCGVYQHDFWFEYSNPNRWNGNGYTGATCYPGNPTANPPKVFYTMNWGYCKAWDTNWKSYKCTVPAPTATATPTRVPTATPTRVPTATPTHRPTRTPTPTNRPTSTPTVTVTPTVTNTPTDTPTGTLTPTATSTPTPTSTPAPSATDTPTSTVTPSALPSTGAPIETWGALFGFLPLGAFMRKFAKVTPKKAGKKSK